MSKFNIPGQRQAAHVRWVTSPLRTAAPAGSAPDARTFEGAPAWKRDARTDLFLRATSSFHGNEKSFYESGAQRDETLRQLTRNVALEDPAWVYEFAAWLRSEGNIRTASLMIAADAVKAILDAGGSTIDTEDWTPPMAPAPGDRGLCRSMIDAVCQRADEPGELLAYWIVTYGKRIPKPVKRGLADAARRLYNERSLLKYDSDKNAVRFADVLELVHPTPHPDKVTWQGDLFKHAIDRRHNRDEAIPESLSLLTTRKQLMAYPLKERRALITSSHGQTELAAAGMTWESLAGWLQGPMDAEAWQAIIPSMGMMAQIRNLRNFDEAGVPDTHIVSIVAKLMDAKEIARSRQLPFRFYSAYKAAPSLRWAHGLEKALDLCLPNIPELPGRTLVLVDTSGSMERQMSSKSTVTYITTAALFGSALALRNHGRVDMYQFANFPALIPVQKGGSVLKHVQAIEATIGSCGHGTNIAESMTAAYAAHDRVIIISDMQTSGYWSRASVSATVPAHIPVYAFNLQASSASPMETGRDARFDLGGLTDSTFAQIPRMESGLSGSWPWQIEETIS